MRTRPKYYRSKSLLAITLTVLLALILSACAAPAAPAAPGAWPIVAKIAAPTITGGKLITGTLNGGGPEISVATMNGDVVLRKLQK